MTLVPVVPSARMHRVFNVGFPTWLLVVLLVAACSSGTVKQADLAPAGSIWFGKSFDPQTFAITDRRTTIGTQEPFVMVAHLSKATDFAGASIRASLNGNLVNTVAVNQTGSGDVFGLALGSVMAAGQWTYDIVDVGGNVLATGSINAQ